MINRTNKWKWLILSLLAIAPLLQAHGTHVHGQGELLVSSQEGELSVLLTLPAMDVLGFEHAPSSAAQEAAIREAAEKFNAPLKIVMPDARADCVVQSSKVESVLLSTDEKNHHHGHADFVIEYQFSCASPKYLNQVTVQLFEWLPAVTINAQAVTEYGAEVASLNRRSPVLVLSSAP
ncbi:DUF2796 domain-containing protein [Alcanivorax sp. 1008]|uniref:DUF2796 domain-containing protein n=1 Tax=Alcanivorax sp. 1008 TaxID=2816853 RepID=UPI001D386CA0|nr:DUF2796 domain-containing protein [Alcanivorax sp. 1008]MCC1496691.1 DUF2796 domain-containing protein [Alcanivorax sp. 1008]